MELDELKAAWQQIPTPEKSSADLQLLLSENNHPVIKGIRKQLTAELMGWSAMLAVYYTMLDGDRKPVWLNILLIVSILLPCLHNLAGYRVTRYVVNGATIRDSLANYLKKVKVYAAVSVLSRMGLSTGLLLFLTYGIKFNTGKYVVLAVIILVFAIQFLLLLRLWAMRLHKLKNAAATFN